MALTSQDITRIAHLARLELAPAESERMLTQIARHRSVSPRLVRGHAGHELNERADRLAQDAAATATTIAPPTPVVRAGDQMDLDV